MGSYHNHNSRTRIVTPSANGRIAMDTISCRREPEEMDQSFLYTEEVIEDEGNTTHVLRWFVKDYARIVAGTQYRCHYIHIGKSIHNLRLLKLCTKTREEKSYCVLLGLTPVPTCAKVSFVIMSSRNKEIHPETNGTLGHIPDRDCFYEFSESRFLSEDLNLVALCKITAAKRVRFALGVENSTLSQDFEWLHDCGLFSDVKICVGNKEFDAHKVVLASRSSVFEAILRYKTRENSESRIEIQDSNELAVGELLRYLYAEKTIPLTTDLALDLFELADIYDIENLKSQTADYLRCNFSIDNILDILVAADLHDENVMKEEAIEFVCRNLWHLLKSPKWSTFRTRLELVDCILEFLS